MDLPVVGRFGKHLPLLPWHFPFKRLRFFIEETFSKNETDKTYCLPLRKALLIGFRKKTFASSIEQSKLLIDRKREPSPVYGLCVEQETQAK